MRLTSLGPIVAMICAAPLGAMEGAPASNAQWSHGLSSDPGYFPIAVWLQSPSNAAAYKAAGVNLYVGLWAGPTEQQLTDLTTAGMRVLCDQNAVGLAHKNDAIIAGWTQQDEPDNAQDDGSGGYGPPILPSVIQGIYHDWHLADPTRPVYLNCGQGCSYTTWIGRGTRTGHTEDYPPYFAGCDIASFDIYPVNNADTTVSGKLWYVPQGVDNLRTWTSNAKPVWCWIETTRISADSPAKPTPAQVRSEVWMAIIRGANGIGYFCHSWYPSFDEPALLHDATMLAAVKAINQRIAGLAAVINSASVAGGVTTTSSNGAVPIDTLVKTSGGATYVFAAAMRSGTTTASFTLPLGNGTLEVLDESRSLSMSGGHFSDAFSGYAVHLYRVTAAAGTTTGGGSTATGGSSGGSGGAPVGGGGGSSHTRCGLGSAAGLALGLLAMGLWRRARG
jgi:hypothetical protein